MTGKQFRNGNPTGNVTVKVTTTQGTAKVASGYTRDKFISNLKKVSKPKDA